MRFHAAIAGPERSSAPLVVLIHTFGQFWWAWRNQIPALMAAGFRVAAIDLRGVGASDKPPRGYDVPTRTRDVAALIRSLGHDRAVIVGHGTGGEVAWSMAALQPAVTRAVAALSSPHPSRVHSGLSKRLTPAASHLVAFAQVPFAPERRLVDGDILDRYFALGAASPLADEAIDLYRTVMRIPFAAHTSVEALRWSVRSLARGDGRRYAAAVRRVLAVPALQVHGAKDGIMRLAGAEADGAALARDFRFEVIDRAGHFLPEETPNQVTDLLLNWLASLP